MFGIELYTSRETTMGKDPSATFMYLVRTDTDSEAEVRRFVLAETPASYGDVPNPRLRLWRLKSKQTPLGNNWWTAQIDYGLAGNETVSGNPNDPNQNQNQTGNNDPLSVDVEINAKGVQQTITQSLYTAQKVKGQGDTRDFPDYRGAIQVSKEGIKGTEIPVPSMAWSETWTWNALYVTWGYINAISNLIGRTNQTRFRTFTGGEVMFDGFDSSAKSLEQRKITYHFHRSPNVTIPAGTFTNKDGQQFPAFNKDGHQFLWFEYEQTVIGNNAIVYAPRAAYVEEVGRPGLTSGGVPSNQDDFVGILRIGA